MVAIRRAEPDDAESIHAFVVALAEYEREPGAVEVTADVLRAQLASPRPPFECLLAEIDGTPVGFALYFHTYSTWRGREGLWLEDLFVLPESRGRGIGRALLTRIGSIARERNCARVEWSVLDWNESALGFYRHLGAVALDEWTTHRLTGAALDRLAADA